MAIKIPNLGEDIILALLVNKGTYSLENIVLKLYTNDVTPGDADTETTYTEASGDGYAAKTLTGASWTITQGNPTTAAYAQQTWTITAQHTYYGYFLVQATSGKLIGAERFTDGPYTTGTSGGTINVTPQITGQSTN